MSKIEHPPSSLDNAMFGGKGCDAGIRRPDSVWLGKDRVVSVELDEHSHQDRVSECEVGKMYDQFVAWQTLLGCVSVFYVRFNPDEYDGTKTSVDERVEAVARRVGYLLTMDITGYSTLAPHVEFHYYHSKAEKHVDAVRHAPESFLFMGENT